MPLPDDESKVFLMPGEQIKKPHSVRVTIIILIAAILTLMGIINLYSASYGPSYFLNQVKNLVVVIPAFLATAFLLPMRRVNAASWWIYGAVVLSLGGVLVIGNIAGGAQRWIRIGGFGFQPSEFAKLTTAIITANFFSSQRLPFPYRIRDLLPILLTIGLIFVLIFLQPDFGTAGLCVLIFLCQVAFVRIDPRSVMIVALVGPVLAVLGWVFALMPYQKMRILNLFNPNLDPQNTGYNSLQSLIAIGSGNGFGKGYMQGTQAQLKFLPERHTDFVFSVLAEEHGFLGCALVFGFFVILIYLALEIARQAKDTFCSLLAVGIASFLFLEFAINVAMVLGVFPVVGVPLPFFSYGSSNLFTVCVSLGLLISINREIQLDRDPRRNSNVNYPVFTQQNR